VRATRAVTAAAAIALLVAAGRLARYEIADHSMEPTLRPGDWVIAVRRPRSIRRGDVVIVAHPRRPAFEMVKRVAALAGEPAPSVGMPIPPNGIWLLGDHAEAGSVDSRVLGSFPAAAVRARVLARYRPLPPRLIR
jgi:signal peptidase I